MSQKRRTSRAAKTRRVGRAGKGGAPTSAKANPLNDFIERGARSLNLRIEQAWLPAIAANLQVTLRHGMLVESFDLPDDIDPAPVFEP